MVRETYSVSTVTCTHKYHQNHKWNTDCKYNHIHITQGKFHLIFQHDSKCFHHHLPPHLNTTNTHLQIYHMDCL